MTGITTHLRALDLCGVKVNGLLGDRLERTWYNNLLALEWEKDFLAPFREKRGGGGEYVGLGKTLEGLVRFAAWTRVPQLTELRRHLIETVLAAQETDGYLGTYRPESRVWRVWDVHEQAYLLAALVTDWELFGDDRSRNAAARLGDYLTTALSARPLTQIENDQLSLELTTLGLDRALLALHRATGELRYLDFCLQVLRLSDWNRPIVEGRHGKIEGHAYAYLTRCLAQLDLYELTGDARLLAQSRRVLTYLRGGSLLVTGSCSLSECWHSDQTGNGELEETCATAYLIRWLNRWLQLDQDGAYGDWMERAIYNALLAAQSPDGLRLRYYTPLEGPRVYWDKDTYCCPGNFRRIMAELPAMIYYRRPEGLLVNLYTASSVTTPLDGGLTVELQQETDYPRSGLVRLQVNPSRSARFALWLRRPAWCREWTLHVNGSPVAPAAVRGFLQLERTWQAGDEVRLEMPMSVRSVRGFRQQAGQMAHLRGPVLLGRQPDGRVTEFLDPESVVTYEADLDPAATTTDELLQNTD